MKEDVDTIVIESDNCTLYINGENAEYVYEKDHTEYGSATVCGVATVVEETTLRIRTNDPVIIE